MPKLPYPVARAYRLLQPGPVLLLATASRDGTPDVMPMAWHMPVDSDPARVAFVCDASHLSFDNLVATKECTLNIPTRPLAGAVAACGSVSGRSVDKFAAYGLTPRPSAHVAPPTVEECPASFECRLLDASLAESLNLLVVEIVAAHVDPVLFPDAAPGRPLPPTLHHLHASLYCTPADRPFEV